METQVPLESYVALLQGYGYTSLDNLELSFDRLSEVENRIGLLEGSTEKIRSLLD